MLYACSIGLRGWHKWLCEFLSLLLVLGFLIIVMVVFGNMWSWSSGPYISDDRNWGTVNERKMITMLCSIVAYVLYLWSCKVRSALWGFCRWVWNHGKGSDDTFFCSHLETLRNQHSLWWVSLNNNWELFSLIARRFMYHDKSISSSRTWSIADCNEHHAIYWLRLENCVYLARTLLCLCLIYILDLRA